MRILFAITLLSLAYNVTAQDSLYITLIEDEMEDTRYAVINENNLVSNEDKSAGFLLKPWLSFDKSNDVQCLDMIVQNVGLGDCVEDATLIILFEDKSKITLNSWNKFNCEGKSYFSLSKNDIVLLSTQSIKMVRFTNGYSYDSMTNPALYKDYFINLYKTIEIWNEQH